MVIIGIGITIKYPAAILLFPYSVMFLFREFVWKREEQRRWLDIPKYGAITFAVIFLTVFIIAPNLITNFEAVIRTLRMEARDYHIGADGLGFRGNLWFYFNIIVSDLGTVSMVPFFIGLVYMLIKREREYTVLLIGFFYWICMSVLSLHWVRWGIPMFISYILAASFGIGISFQIIEDLFQNKKIALIFARIVWMLLCFLLILNVSLFAAAKVKFSTIPDARNITVKELPERGITADNSAFEPYSPFAVDGFASNASIDNFHITDTCI
jgi:hypothetical protein